MYTWAQTETGYLIRSRGQRWDDAERNALLGLAHYDLCDVFRQVNGYTTEACSWTAQNRGRQWPRRFDYVFASMALRPVRCEYMQSSRKDNLSDHAAMASVFDW